ncbi:MAG TPA: cation-translocating P-type ATPase [Anaerolineales bacterium]|nr:cation-translocating P-type ATPase [Anaerolineales bacterium]
MSPTELLEVHIQGMDCADCTRQVQQAIARLPGVEAVEVFLASEKALIRHAPGQLELPAIRKAVAEAGYSVPTDPTDQASTSLAGAYTRQVLTLLGLLFGAILFVVLVGEGLGWFERLTQRLPWPLGLGAVLLFGFPVFRKVGRAALKGQVIAHSLMSLGVLAALAVGEWATAAVVVFFMRVGDYTERFTTERARRAVRDLNSLAPRLARLLRDGVEVQVPATEVQVGEIVVVRPGEHTPVDGEVVAGHASVDQSTITGESLPVEAGPGAQVYAASLVSLGSLRVRAARVGAQTTFGQVIQLVEQAEARRGEVQRLADRFSSYYLPIVVAIAALTFILRRDPLAAAAVLVVACSCSFALATPIAILASIGASARRGLLIKGGKHLETLARADTLLIDKTGTLTLGKPRISALLTAGELIAAPGVTGQSYGASLPESHDSLEQRQLLFLAASAERYSEHPLAEAVRQAAVEAGLSLVDPQSFEALPGLGVQAQVEGRQVTVGKRGLIKTGQETTEALSGLAELESQGKTLLFVSVDGVFAGVLAAEDTLRPEVPQAIAAARSQGIRQIELLTGDNRQTAADLASQLGIGYRAELLPEDKIAVVQEYQARGHIVVMVGDGVNDAPALAQADVGIAMGQAAAAVATEAAHIALLRQDWNLVPQALQIARRTMRVVKMNIAFTAVYNLVGISLAALGFLPPIFAAAAQSLPDLGILANSSRLLKQK